MAKRRAGPSRRGPRAMVGRTTPGGATVMSSPGTPKAPSTMVAVVWLVTITARTEVRASCSSAAKVAAIIGDRPVSSARG